jgi:hypothetical protein
LNTFAQVLTAPDKAPKEGVGLLSSNGTASSNNAAMTKAVKVKDDGAVDQVKDMNTKKGMAERKDKDGNEFQKGMEANKDCSQ